MPIKASPFFLFNKRKKKKKEKQRKRLVNEWKTMQGHKAVATNVIVVLLGRLTEDFLFLDFYGDL